MPVCQNGQRARHFSLFLVHIPAKDVGKDARQLFDRFACDPSQHGEERTPEKKELVGMDIFVQWTGDVSALADRLVASETRDLHLQMITNRGVKVWPEGFPETFHTDHWRCRFISNPQAEIPKLQLQELVGNVLEQNLDFIKAETLCLFDGKPGFSLGQGQ